MAVRDFLLLNRRDREALSARLQAVLSRWQREWCIHDADAPSVALCASEESVGWQDIEWQRAADGEATTMVGLPAADTGALLAGLIGEQQPNVLEDTVARELKQAALQSLALLLLSEGKGDAAARSVRWSGEAPGAETWDSTAGFAAAQCRCNGISISVVLNPRLVVRYVTTKVPGAKRTGVGLVPVRAALSAERVTLEVCAGEAQLLLPELATLAVGDVIRLDRGLEQPALVKLGSGPALCGGHLGIQGDSKAVQLAFLSESNEV